MRRDDLARLYRIINDRQIEAGQMFVHQVLVQQPGESNEQFAERRTRVANTFITIVTVTGSNNENVTGSGEHFLASENIPDEISKFSTALSRDQMLSVSRPCQTE